VAQHLGAVSAFAHGQYDGLPFVWKTDSPSRPSRGTIDRREIARGESAWIEAPPEGEHDLALTVAWASVETTACQPRPPGEE